MIDNLSVKTMFAVVAEGLPGLAATVEWEK
jgi:hypothetical protein